MGTIRSPKKLHTTTVRLPSRIYDQAQRCVRAGQAASINDFIVRAIDLKLKILNRKEIDARFTQMANDTNYQHESRQILEQFEASDAEMLEGIDN